VSKEYLDMVCIQDTKVDSINPSLCWRLWGINLVDWKNTIEQTK